MALADKRLKEIAFLPAAAAAQVTNASGVKTRVQLIVLHNTDSSARVVTVYNVPDSGGSVGTAAAANQMIYVSINPGETVIFDFGKPGLVLIDQNDTIQALADVANKVTIQVYGFDE